MKPKISDSSIGKSTLFIMCISMSMKLIQILIKTVHLCAQTSNYILFS